MCQLDSSSRKFERGFVNQTRWCREAFGVEHCHVFLHTWSGLDKNPVDHSTLTRLNLTHGSRAGTKALASASSEQCVQMIRDRVDGLIASVETQNIDGLVERAKPWGVARELVDINMRMQVEGISRGVAMAARHLPCYDALVRMRADVGAFDPSSRPAAVFLNPIGWANIARRAALARTGARDGAWAREVVTCSWPRVKQTDFCLWSAPPAPLAGVVGALVGDGFDRTVWGEGNCSGFLQDQERDGGPNTEKKLIPHAPVVSENILLCGMRTANASWSRRTDHKPFDDRAVLPKKPPRRNNSHLGVIPPRKGARPAHT